MVHEARGDTQQAADCYRKVIALIRAHPDDYEPSFEEVFAWIASTRQCLPSPVLSARRQAVPLAGRGGFEIGGKR
jgi:hypothetical protein